MSTMSAFCLLEQSSIPTLSSLTPVFHYVQSAPVPVTHSIQSGPVLIVSAVYLAYTLLVIHCIAPYLLCVHAVLASFHIAPIIYDGPTTLPSFTFYPMFVPPISSPTPLPFPLCPMPVLTASITTQAQPSLIELTCYAVLSVPHEPCKGNSDAEHALLESQKQEAGHLLHHYEDKEGVSI